MRTFASLNQFNFFSGVFRHVINLNAITAGETNQQCLIVRRDKHISGHGARFHAPLDGLGVQINGDQLIAVLHGGPHSGALAVNPHVAGCFSRLNALDQGGRLPIPFVDVDVIESVGDRDEPFHVGRKTQVIRIQNAWNDALDFCGSGVDEGQRIGQGIGHNDRFFIWREVQMVRLFASRNALGFSPSDGVNDTDIPFEGI